MGKIRGWALKGHHQNGVSVWVSVRGNEINTLDFSPYGQGRVYQFIVRIGKKWTGKQVFPSRKKANDYAVSYMRRHSKG